MRKNDHSANAFGSAWCAGRGIYKAAFGARVLFRVDAPDGAVVARLGRVVDPYGHHWEIGKPLPGRE